MLEGTGLPYRQRLETRPGTLDRACLALFGHIAPYFDRAPRRLRARAIEVEARAAACASLSDISLRAALEALRPRLRREGLAGEPLGAALALFAEACRRSSGLRPHQVQLMGALAMAEGRLAEMQTGEGKTIVAVLVAGAAGLSGLPTHVVTVNDYLAGRDAALARSILAYAGLTVGIVRHGDSTTHRRAQYRCDVTYVSNKELAFDYLRDRVALEAARRRPQRHRFGAADLMKDGLILRGLHFAVVDEADSILIDEARTPLILSRDAEILDAGQPDACRQALQAAAGLVAHRHFTLKQHARQVALTPEGSAAIAAALGTAGGVWRARHAREELVRHALAARLLYKRDRDYIVADGVIRIVDAHTGRIAEGRSWQDGLHQMIEAAEGLASSTRQATSTSITFQSFFSRYLKLAGLSGTLVEVAAESRSVYGRPTISIPTHLPARRKDFGARLLRSAEGQRRAVAASAATQAAAGRPVLIGTRSVASPELLSHHLTRAGLAPVVLNARHDADEAAIVAQAGRAGRITIATNMAGRGTDIRPDAAAIDSGGLHVILTELHESRRIDRQLIGRSGRQGDPGSSEMILSLEDEVLRGYARTSVAVVGRLCAVWPLLTPLGLRWLRLRAQFEAERRHRLDRRRLTHAHAQLEERLSFAGTAG